MSAAAAIAPLEQRPGDRGVRIAPGVLEEIRDRVLDGYAAAPHGGVELGFVLFGRKQNGRVTIEHFREIPCAHLLSPRFLLAPDEEERFPGWMEMLADDPQLEGAEAVGWGCSHHRSDLTLLDREIAFHGRFFPHGGAVMVVKPQGIKAVLAGVFLPDTQGALNTEQAAVQVRSTVLDGMPGKSAAAMERQARGIEEVRESQEEVRRRSLERKMQVIAERKRRFRFPKWSMVVAGGAIVAALVVFGVLRGFGVAGGASASPSLSVAIHPEADNLAFTWMGNIAHVKSAKIKILDGAAVSHFNVTGSFRPSGVFMFPHQSGMVQAVLTVETDAGTTTRSIEFVDGRKSAGEQGGVQTGVSLAHRR